MNELKWVLEIPSVFVHYNKAFFSKLNKVRMMRGKIPTVEHHYRILQHIVRSDDRESGPLGCGFLELHDVPPPEIGMWTE